LRQADPHLAAMLGIFGRLHPDKDLPEWEQLLRVLSSQGRLRRAAVWMRGRHTQPASVGEAGAGLSDYRDQKLPRNGRSDGGLRQPDRPA
jgi:hypothetical protein